MNEFQHHIVKGKIYFIGSDYLHLKLANNKGKGRLPYENIIDPPPAGTFKQHFVKGQIFTVFLESNEDNNPFWWRLNQHWVENNPWENLTVGETVYGVVNSYYKNCAAFVWLEDKGRLSGFLHIRDTLHNATTIQEELEVGDHIYAVITNIDDKKLKVSLSLKALLEQEKYRQQTSVNERLLLDQLDHYPVVSPDLSNVYWLIIEDDNILFSRLKQWAEELNCTVKRAKNIQHLKQLLRGGCITHISVDANLNAHKLNKDSKAYLTRIKHHRSPVQTIIMSGDKQAQQLAKKFSLPFILKPVPETLLLHWLQDKKDDFEQVLHQQNEDWEDEAVHWQAEGLECEVKKQSQSELKHFVKEKKCVAALVALRVREGVIQIRTHYGLISPNFETVQYDLMHTLVNNIIETGVSETRDSTTFGNMATILPPEAKYAYGFPVAIYGECERAVIFFRETAFSAEDQNSLQQILPLLESLCEKLSIIQAWDEDRVFANLGRFSSAVMHELRNDIGLLKTPIRKLKRMAIEKNVSSEDLYMQIHSLEQRYGTIESLLENNLNLIRQYRHGQFSLNRVLEKIISFYQYEYQEKKEAKLVVDGDLPIIRLDFPVLAFEQSLINLLQNAFYHIEKNKGRVMIRVLEKTPNKKGHSIFIDIVDNGCGIPASMKGQLFKPRETIKGHKGTGMGLYISRNLLRAHGGDLILAESIRYFGTCFRICLPREFDDAS